MDELEGEIHAVHRARGAPPPFSTVLLEVLANHPRAPIAEIVRADIVAMGECFLAPVRIARYAGVFDEHDQPEAAREACHHVLNILGSQDQEAVAGLIARHPRWRQSISTAAAARALLDRKSVEVFGVAALGSCLADGQPRFIIDGLVAEGADGVVAIASDRLLSPEREGVVVKLLRSSSASVESEARAMSLLRRTVGTGVLDCGTTAQGVRWLASERISGRTVAAMCSAEDGPDLDSVANALADLADALAELQSAGVAHGDISPVNVLIDSCGRFRLVDFSRACTQSSDTTIDAEGLARVVYLLAQGYVPRLGGLRETCGSSLRTRLLTVAGGLADGSTDVAAAARLLRESIRATRSRRIAIVAIGIFLVLVASALLAMDGVGT